MIFCEILFFRENFSKKWRWRNSWNCENVHCTLELSLFWYFHKKFEPVGIKQNFKISKIQRMTCFFKTSKIFLFKFFGSGPKIIFGSGFGPRIPDLINELRSKVKWKTCSIKTSSTLMWFCCGIPRRARHETNCRSTKSTKLDSNLKKLFVCSASVHLAEFGWIYRSLLDIG